jgi:phage terminase large subunit GpA-like protein
VRSSSSPNSPAPTEVEAVDRAFFRALRPPEQLSVSDWADRYRVLSGRAAAEPGRWRTDRTPYLREIMDALSPNSPVELVAFMAGAQVGKTEAGNNWIGATIDQAPGAMLVVWPTVEVAKKNSKLRIGPLIESTPILAAKVRPNRERDSGNTILSKEFPGGILLITGANSSAGLRSTPCGKLFLDEVDVYPPDVDGEGDPMELAIVRARTYHRRKIFVTSTPTIEGRSRIAAQFEQGDQRRYEVPCPFCSKFQVLEWINLRWENDDPETVRYYCSGCGAAIEEGAHKTAMLAGGRWVARNPRAPANRRSYHLSALYSPIPWYSWPQAVRDFLRAKESLPLLRVFANTVWGEPWTVKGEAPEWERLYNRRETYPLGIVPRRGLILTAGVDVQKDRIEVEVVAWGRNLESWTVAYLTFPGDTELDSTWVPLEELLAQSFPHEGGSRLPVRMAAVDASFNQNRVLSWTRKQPTDRVLAVKGHGRYPILIGQPKVVDVETHGRKVHRGAKLWPVGVGIAKSELYGWLKVEPPTDPDKGYPRGFCHFPLLPEEFFRQLCAELLRAGLGEATPCTSGRRCASGTRRSTAGSTRARPRPFSASIGSSRASGRDSSALSVWNPRRRPGKLGPSPDELRP